MVGEPEVLFLDEPTTGMNLMSGSMRGVAWVVVQMRTRKLLKRLLAAPMRRCFRWTRAGKKKRAWLWTRRAPPANHLEKWPSVLSRLSSVDQTDAKYGGPPTST